ncbi:hypothetical protein SAMN02745219_02537 [Desulfofundulus thermosubterraneus DSM 16057]|uniref:Uncharacterized protein n=1 Tax=Desulfofundulus thermosubterraneus DSM 16057 TaxID=1121432 RepID=A0A1M6J925_9FIRM|nr:hypothetical protein SAMN02745219_02537 [Desulfofundulus thermosubterraneus DSM 16057]
MTRQGLNEAARHFSRAKSAFDRSEWESANSQVRSALESLFNAVAKLRLNSNKTGGAARQELQDAGLLRTREAKLVQEFIAVAGGSGSHAGVSNADESLGRFLAGIGIAYIGLALIPELVRVEDVLVGQLTAPAGTRLPTDKEVYTTCPTCGIRQTLAQAKISRDGKNTVYTCMHGCQTIVVVGEPEDAPWEGRGYRLGDHVIRNAQDMYLPIIGTGKEVLIPASKGALMKQRPSSS